MKKILSNIYTLAALLMAGAAFTACSSSDDIIEQPAKPTEPQVYTLVIKASKGDNASTRALSLSGSTLNAYWSGTETIEVEQNGVIIGTATAAPSPNGNTTITATLNSTLTSGDLKFYLGGGIFDYTGQVGLLTGTSSISEKYDYNTALLYSGNFTVSGNKITLTGSNPTLNFENPKQAVVKFTLKDKGNSDAAINATKLNIHDSKADGLVQSLNKYSIAWTYGDVTISPATTNVIYAALSGVYQSNLTLTALAGNDVFSYSKSGVNFNFGNYYEVTVKMNKILTNVTGTNPLDILTGGYTTLSVAKAEALAKECWNVAGGTVYVVYSASASPYNVSYASYDGSTLGTGSASNANDWAALYAGGSNSAWYVEPTYTMAAAATTSDKGKLICTAGHIHSYNEDAFCKATRVAKIIYVGETGDATYSHGLAFALADEGTMNWSTAMSTCSGKNTSTPVASASWLLASKDQWEYMMGSNGAGSFSNLRYAFNNVGGTDMDGDPYWSSTEDDSNSDNAYYYYFNYNTWSSVNKVNYQHNVRACLAF